MPAKHQPDVLSAMAEINQTATELQQLYLSVNDSMATTAARSISSRAKQLEERLDTLWENRRQMIVLLGAKVAKKSYHGLEQVNIIVGQMVAR